MKLRFGGTRADGGNGETVGEELGVICQLYRKHVEYYRVFTRAEAGADPR